MTTLTNAREQKSAETRLLKAFSAMIESTFHIRGESRSKTTPTLLDFRWQRLDISSPLSPTNISPRF
jgi:hypothetical protein